MNKFLVSALLLILIIGSVQAQVKRESSQPVNTPGLKQMKAGKTLTICGGVLFVGGIILASQADSYYYNSYSSSNGSYEEGDPKGAVGVVMIAGGVGMMVPGIILWTKGSKKYKAYQQKNPQANLSLGINNNGLGLHLRF